MLLLSFVISLLSAIYPPQVQWATSVIGFSTEAVDRYGSPQFRAKQALGKPNKLPAYGISGCAWAPKVSSEVRSEWIEVGFSKPIQAQQVLIGENYRPGHIIQVILKAENGKEYPVFFNQQIRPETRTGKLHAIHFKRTLYKISSVKVVMQSNEKGEIGQIDCIGLADTKENIRAEIHETKVKPSGSILSLGTAVNSAYDEIFPVISPDGKTLYFDRKNHPNNMGVQKNNDDIWFSQRIADKWTKAQHLPEPLNNAYHNYVCSVTPDGNTLLLGNIYRKGAEPEGGISWSHRTGNGWSFPEALVIEGYENRSEYSEYNLAPNRKAILMAIENAETLGDRDIYVSFHVEGNRWSKPINLGGNINSAGTELTPFLASDNKTLYFASNGHSGYGATDMFVSRRLDDSWTNWSEPVNLGASLNSPHWDASYTIDAKGEYAYFVSYQNSVNGSADLFKVKLPEDVRPEPVALVKGKVLNAHTKRPMGAEISYEVSKNSSEEGLAASDPSTGEFMVVMPLGQVYRLWASAQDFMPDQKEIDLQEQNGFTEVNVELYLSPLDSSNKLSLDNILFEQGKPNILPESEAVLLQLVKMFRQNPSLNIRIEGHTDIEGNPIMNLYLSRDRTQKIKSFLVDQGIHAGRIETQAYGEKKPLTTERTPEGMRKNRRVEFIVIEQEE